MSIEDKLKEGYSELLKKMSRKGRMVLIGIIGIAKIPRPDEVTWESVEMYIIPVVSILILSFTGILAQYYLDSKGKKEEEVILPNEIHVEEKE